MKEKLERRLREVENRLDWLDMADRLRADERAERTRLLWERDNLRWQLSEL